MKTSGTTNCNMNCQKKFLSFWERTKRVWLTGPVLLFFGLNYSLMSAVSGQLLIDRTCSVNFGFNDSICKNLTAPENDHLEIAIQKQVAQFNVAGNFIEDLPNMMVSLFLGTSVVTKYKKNFLIAHK